MNNFDFSFYTRKQQESQNQTGIFVFEKHNGTELNTVQCQQLSGTSVNTLRHRVSGQSTTAAIAGTAYEKT